MDTKNKPLYKFTIYNKLQDMTKRNYELALFQLPELLCITERQFKNYMYAKLDGKENLTSDKLILIAKYFNCSMEDMFIDIDSIINKVDAVKRSSEFDYSFFESNK